MKYYPVYLDLAGERAVVIGADPLADEKAALLQEAGAVVERLAAADYRDGILAGARIVIDAGGDLELNARVWAEAEAAGILVNVVETEGESPFLASTLRKRLETWLGSEWGPFTALVGRIRRGLRRRGIPLADQTPVYRRLLNSRIREHLRAGRTDAAEYEAAAIAATAGALRPGRVALVGAGPGDPGLLTVAAQELLAGADLVFHDALVGPEVLAMASPDAELVAVGKRGGRRSARQDEITAALIEAAGAGREVVRLKGGDPFVFGRGGEELNALLAAGIEVVVVSGVSVAVAASAAAGISFTMCWVSASVAVATATGADADIPERLIELAAAADTLVLLMPLGVLDELAARLAGVLGPQRPAAVIADATLPTERVVRGTLADIAGLARAGAVAAPATLVVGEVVNAVSRRPMAATVRVL